jgi:exopolyphosphatase/guanosine-5'-triphosphate,3'-diphosphate pyrophosphatase
MSVVDKSKIGILDIGTFSLRFDIFQIDPLKLEPIGSFRLIHRAGESDLSDDAEAERVRARFACAFDEIRAIAMKHGVGRIIGGATGLFRVREDFAQGIIIEAGQRGIVLRVLSGDEELTLIASGIIRFFPDRPRSSLLIDIGGGSSEVSLVRDDKLVCGESVPIGVLVAKNIFPPGESGRFELPNLTGMRELFRNTFHELHKRFTDITTVDPEIVIGSSGSARELERVLNSVGKYLTIQQLESFFLAISDKSTEQLVKTDGIDPKRVDLLVPGTAIFVEAMREFSLNRAKVSHYSLRHGILAAEIG